MEEKIIAVFMIITNVIALVGGISMLIRIKKHFKNNKKH